MSGVNFAQPDVTLVLDDGGVIRKATLSNSIAREGVGAWLGRPWFDTVALTGTNEIRQIMDDARESGVSAFRKVLQRFPSGLELPIEYTTVRAAGKNGGLLAMGRNLTAVAELQSRLVAAQQATEREYWKLRDVETRYRLLFDASTEAVLMISAEDFRVVEANPAAVRSLGMAPGRDFLADLVPAERDVFTGMLLRVREHGRAPGILMRVGAGRDAWTVRATLMAADPGLRYLLHMSPTGVDTGEPALRSAPPKVALSVDALISRLPDAFVALNDKGVVLRANRAFLDLVQVATEGGVVGADLGRWLSQPGGDARMLLDAVQRDRTARLLTMTVTGDLGTETVVEVSAAGNADGAPAFYGVLLRDVSRRMNSPVDEHLASVLGAVTEQIGRTPLLQVVRETSDAVERHYIKAALARVDGNRTAAAELLGLSRQSLHAKLNRYAAGPSLTGCPSLTD